MIKFDSSELIINSDGSIFHLHLFPEQIADKIILVGDPGRVEMVANHFDSIECCVSNREFHTITGICSRKRITVISSGIGCDNIDIVVNELDALANIDFTTRTLRDKLRSLQIVRIGTCGGLQNHTPTGSYIISTKSIGFDGLLNFYAQRNEICDTDFEKAFMAHMDWEQKICIPYVINADPELVERLYTPDMIRGITISCGGFYGPQGRKLRLPLADPEQNTKIVSFRYKGQCITNFEMESSALSGLCRLMGHQSVTVCMVVADRLTHHVNTTYKGDMDKLIETVLQRI